MEESIRPRAHGLYGFVSNNSVTRYVVVYIITFICACFVNVIEKLWGTDRVKQRWH